MIPLTPTSAEAYAKRFTPLERKVILLCSKERSWGYKRLSEMTGATYREIQKIGRDFQVRSLAYVSPVRHADEFAGSTIFLNERGLLVKEAVSKLKES
ncbi:hypothetical protein [Novosphingobium sp.]|uniref:hypothetical protein n=1 Tax=Novosphingobium sp. TaxID=1874826 RepID=UPI00286DF2EA|nr:hypothetical protein [Novosphingobium sp.]